MKRLIIIMIMIVSLFTPLLTLDGAAKEEEYVSLSEVLLFEVKETYAGEERSYLSLGNLITILNYVNIPKSDLAEDGTYGRLNVVINGEAVKEYYGNLGYCYSGAKITGKITLKLNDGSEYSRDFAGEIPPPVVLTYNQGTHPYAKPSDAPFNKIKLPEMFFAEMSSMIYGIFGTDNLVYILKNYTPPNKNVMKIVASIANPELAEITPILIDALEGSDMYVAADAAKALGKIGSETEIIVPALVEALGHNYPIIRRTAAEALGIIGPEAVDAVPVLIETLRDKDFYVQECVQNALKMITGKEFANNYDYYSWKNWWEEERQ